VRELRARAAIAVVAGGCRSIAPDKVVVLPSPAFRQPPVYFLESWALVDGPEPGRKGPAPFRQQGLAAP